MKINKEILQELVWEEECEGFSVVQTRILDTSRWSVIHEMIFTDGEKNYRSSYSVGATEMQDERPYEYDNSEVDVVEVVPVEETIIKYVKKDS